MGTGPNTSGQRAPRAHLGSYRRGVARYRLCSFLGTWGSLGAITAVQVVVFARVREHINAILSTSDPGKTSHFVADELSNRTSDLAVVADLLKQLEEQPFKSAPLAALRSRLNARGQPASRVIGRLQRLSEMHARKRTRLSFR